MSSFTERVQVLIDVTADKATTMVQRFRTEVSNANGITGKFKAGASSALDAVKAKAGQLALAGGAALIAFGIKAVEAFTNTAKAAVDLGKKTGLTTEEASRWIAVGDDYEVTADQIAGTMGRLGKNMDAEAMKKYGIETRDAGGHARDANDIFLDVLEVLNNTDPADRSRVAAELLGKGWQSIAPLLGKTREEYEEMLGAVEDGQVITDKEAAKAERMRLAQDALADALNEVTLAAGQLIAENADLIEGLAGAVTVMTDLNDRFGTYINLAKDLTNPFAAIDLDEDLLALEGGVIKSTIAVDAFGATADDATPDVEAFFDAFAEAKGRASDVEDLSDAFGGLLGLLDVEDAAADVAEAFDDVATAATEAYTAAENGSADAEKKTRDHEQSIRDLKRDVIEFGDSVNGLPKERVTEILAAIDAGSLTEAQRLFDVLTAEVVKNVTVYVHGKFGSLGGKFGNNAAGTSYGSGLSRINEQGPELIESPDGSATIVDLPAGSKVHTAKTTADLLGGGPSIVDRSTHHWYLPQQTPESLIEAQARYRYRNARSS